MPERKVFASDNIRKENKSDLLTAAHKAEMATIYGRTFNIEKADKGNQIII